MAKPNPRQEIENLLERLPHKFCVYFALYCAKDVFQYVKAEDKAVIKGCIDTVELWLIDKASAQEVEAAGYAANAANAAGSPAPYYAANAAGYAANAANAAGYAAGYAANAAANAAGYAGYAGYAANAADYHKNMARYLKHLKTMIDELGMVEKAFYNL